jgi:hypothetical protein
LPVLDNDKGNGIGVTSLLDKSVGFRGEISIPAGRQSITYELPWTYEGAAFIDKFKYIIRNSTGQSAQASVTIQVTPGEPLQQQYCCCQAAAAAAAGCRVQQHAQAVMD